MPKRTNPFGECSPLQFKSHIGMKEVDKICEQTMNTVFGKYSVVVFYSDPRCTYLQLSTTKPIMKLTDQGYNPKFFYQYYKLL